MTLIAKPRATLAPIRLADATLVVIYGQSQSLAQETLDARIHTLCGHGSFNTVIARAQPIADDAGNLVGISGVVIDISVQAKEIETLRQQLN